MQDTFYVDLDRFLASKAGQRYTGDIQFEDPGNHPLGIAATRSHFKWRNSRDANDQIAAMDSVRSTAARTPPPLGTNAFAFSESFLHVELIKSLGREAYTNVGLSCAMIAIVIVILLANLLASALTFVCVASTILELIGFMHLRGTNIDNVAVIFIVISLGLAVDYSVHVAHGYLAVRDKDRNIRVMRALEVCLRIMWPSRRLHAFTDASHFCNTASQ
jgi:Niemann-Pick C1 protein